MAILGIDPGSKATGIAILSDGIIYESLVWNLDGMTEAQLVSEFILLGLRHDISHAVIEAQPSGRGHAATWAAKHIKRCLNYARLPKPSELYPQQWRRKLGLFVFKKSGDLKQQSVDFARQNLKLDTSHDAAEAACIARAFELILADG